MGRSGHTYKGLKSRLAGASVSSPGDRVALPSHSVPLSVLKRGGWLVAGSQGGVLEYSKTSWESAVEVSGEASATLHRTGRCLGDL